jgi:hypothetical protein
MKKAIFLSLLFFFGISPIISSAQTFSLQELLVLINKNIDDFDTYVVSKGFRFQKTKDDLDFKGITYALNQSEYSRKAEKFISLYTKYISDNRTNVTYQTSLSTDYLKIKNQAKFNGFKFIKTENFKGSTFLIYKKDKLELSLTLIQYENEDGKISSGYEISITKNSD